MDRTAEEQIRALTEGLAPVRRIPPLWVTAAAVVAVGSVVLGVEGWLVGAKLRIGVADAPALQHLAMLIGIVLIALTGIGAAMAAAVPGREASVRLLSGAGVIGLLLTLVPGVWLIATGDAQASAGHLAPCIARTLKLGVAPALMGCAFIVYSAVRRPGYGTAVALIGGVALGATAVHATCPSESPLHWIFGHNLAPIAVVSLLTVPIAAVIARWTRRV